MRQLIVLLIAALLTGCAAPGLYQWGGYEGDLYGAYKDPARFENMRVNLEAHIAQTEGAGTRVAPGLYAELGTLYLQMGSSEKAIGLYKKERDAWPESKGLMSAMIRNLERRQQAAQEPGK